MTTEERFWSKVDKDGPVPAHQPELGPCWVWRGSVHGKTGYGQLTVGGKYFSSHRFSLSLTIDAGVIPAGLNVCHHCDNKRCVNPGHLFIGTHKQNMQDMVAKGRGHKSRAELRSRCLHGHALTPENTRHRPHGVKDCRICHRDSMPAYRARKRAGQITFRQWTRKPIDTSLALGMSTPGRVDVNAQNNTPINDLGVTAWKSPSEDYVAASAL
jgi:hypothetical protein